MLNQLLIASIFLLAVFSFLLGIFSLLKNPKSFTVRLWFLMSMAVGVWSGSFLLMLLSQTEQEGIFYSKLLYVGTSFIPIFFYHFVLSFLRKVDNKNKIFLIVGYILAIIFAILSLNKEIIIGASPKMGFLFWLDPGRLHPLLLVYFWIYASVTFYFLYQGYRQSDGVIKRKIFYMLIATIVGFGGGGTSFLPHTLGIYSFGDFVAWLYPNSNNLWDFR